MNAASRNGTPPVQPHARSHWQAGRYPALHGFFASPAGSVQTLAINCFYDGFFDAALTFLALRRNGLPGTRAGFGKALNGRNCAYGRAGQ